MTTRPSSNAFITGDSYDQVHRTAHKLCEEMHGKGFEIVAATHAVAVVLNDEHHYMTLFWRKVDT